MRRRKLRRSARPRSVLAGLLVAALVGALLGIAPAAAATSDLVISEFLASNSTDLQDEDGASSDWIEIHNRGTTTVNLAGLGLTDDGGTPQKWLFPAVSLAPNAYLVVFASSKNRTNPAGELHTNFNLSAGGEHLGLYAANGSTVIDEYSPNYPAQSTDVSYGINSLGQPAFFSTTTPGQPNGVGDNPPADAPTASVDRGFYTAPFSVALSSTTPGAQVRYTTNGSEPTATTGSIYSSPIAVSTTTTLRAGAFSASNSPSTISSYSYLFLDDVIDQPATLPGYPNGRIQSVGDGYSVPLDMAMDPAVVTAYQTEIIGSLESIPTLSMTADLDDIFGSGGFYFGNNIEKATSIEVLHAASPQANEQIDVGVESHSHNRLKRSLRLNFRTEYGTNTWLTDLLQTAPLNGDSATDAHRTLILRGGNNRSWARAWNPDATAYTIDQLYRDSQIAMTGAGSHGTFVHLYLNGTYWGLYNLVERPDDEFQSEYFGGDDADWFFTNHGGAGSADATRWNYLTNGLKNKDMSVAANYLEMQGYLDVERFVDYLILNFWIGMTDWPTNNWYVANRNASSPLGSTPSQFFAWDGEWTLDRKRNSDPDGAAVPNVFKFDTGSPAPITQLWHSLLDNDDFRTLFADRVSLHTGPGGELADTATLARWNTLNTHVESAVVAESARWGDSLETLGSAGPIDFAVTRTRDVDWQTEVDTIAALLAGNAQRLIDALVAAGFYPDIEPPDLSPLGGPVAAGTAITITNPNGSGTIWYTLDGSDPRDPANPSRVAYAGPVAINSSAVLTAAVVDGGVGGPTATQTYVVPSFAVSEVHYHPTDPTGAEVLAGYTSDNNFEFIEFENVSAGPLDTAGLTGAAGISFSLASQTIPAGGSFVVVSNPGGFSTRYGSGPTVAGSYTGQLSNGGEQLAFEYPPGITISDFTYDDVAPWPTAPDGGGPSLELGDGTDDPSDPANWHASAASGGNPGIPSAPPVLKPGVANVVEGNTGSVVVQVPVTLSYPAGAPVTVDWATLDPGGPGIATANVDYIAASGTVTFAPGQTTKTVSITVLGDLIDEPPAYFGEWALVLFSNPSANATLTTSFFGAAILVIIDDDPTPTINPGVANVVEGNTGSVVVQVPVTLSNPSATPITVDWATLDPGGVGVATANVDYIAASGTVTFAPGQTSKTVPITVLGDLIVEPPAYFGEWALVLFSNPSANATINISFFGAAILVIIDDD